VVTPGLPPVPPLRVPMLWAHAGPMRPVRRALVGSPRDASRPPGRGLILDLDDTLYRREHFVRSGFAAVAHHLAAVYGVAEQDANLVMTHALAHGQGALAFQAVCDRFGFPRDIVPSLVDHFRAHRPALWLHPDVASTLRTLRADGWRLVLLTNGLPSVQAGKVAALGLAPLVDGIVYAEEHARGGKPDPEPFRAALRLLGLPASQCVSVGDDVVNDIRAAKAVGVPAIRVARPDVVAMPDDDADVVINSLVQLPDAASLLLTLVNANEA
jgi:putative hydrolase of the HAD superfamily